MVVREWLRDQLRDPRAVFRAVERLASCAASPVGVHAFAQGIDLMQAAPWDDMRAAVGFTEFFHKRMPQLSEHVAGKRQLHLDALREAK